MRKPSSIVRVLAVLGMLAGMLVVTAAPAAAVDPPFPDPGIRGQGCGGDFFVCLGGGQEVYFPWVYNGDEFGLGESWGSVTLQNLTGIDGYVFFYVGNGDGYDYTTYAYLSAGASKTFTADEIGVPAPGAPVVAGLYTYITVGQPVTICEIDYGADINGDGDLLDCIDFDGAVSYYIPLYMGGLVKSAVAGASLPYTTSADTSVSGYNGLSGREVGYFDQLYLPIVQTNCGPGGCWDTRITATNFYVDANAAVTLRFFPADDGSGSLQTGFQLQALVNPGEAWQVVLSDWVPQGWVGSVHVYTDDAVGVLADRFKVGTDMWLTNIGSNQTAEFLYQEFFQFQWPYVLFAPSVYLDFNGWNTGINIANLCECDNNVNVQFYVNAGNAGEVLTQRLAAHGMTYFYNPSQPSEDDSDQEEQYDRIAGALILSEEPVAAAVDAVKYFGNDRNVGQAMTYNATGNLYDIQAMPLVQKGNPSTGMGATSGLNFINPYPVNNTVMVIWLNQSGFLASNFGTTNVIVPPASIGFAYTMNHHNIPNGYYGSAIIVGFNAPIALISANVDYQVQGDGSVMWNGYNPCGLFRQTAECVFEPPLEPLPATATITKLVTCDTCDLDFDFDPAATDPDESNIVEGALIGWDGYDENGFEHSGSGYTNEDGEVVFTVPAGTYDITILDLPAEYDPSWIGTGETVTVGEGDAVSVTNDVTQAPLEGEGLLTKSWNLEGFDVGDPGDPFHFLSEIAFCDASLLSGTTADEVADSGECDELFDPAVVAHGGADNYFNEISFTFEFNALVPAGVYYICWSGSVEGDFDGDPLTPDTSLDIPYHCEGPFYVLDGEETFVSNDVLAETAGTLDVLVENDGTNDLEGIEVCVYEFDPGAPDGVGALVECGDTNSDGEVQFDLAAGQYVVAAHGSLGDALGDQYEDQATVVNYNPAVDLSDGLLDDDLAADEQSSDVYFSLELDV